MFLRMGMWYQKQSNQNILSWNQDCTVTSTNLHDLVPCLDILWWWTCRRRYCTVVVQNGMKPASSYICFDFSGFEDALSSLLLVYFMFPILLLKNKPFHWLEVANHIWPTGFSFKWTGQVSNSLKVRCRFHTKSMVHNGTQGTPVVT